MFRPLILLIFFISCAQVASTRAISPIVDSIEFNDVIIVTTGGRIVGEIVEIEENKKIVILRKDGERIEVPWKKIAHITRLGEEDQTQQMILDSLALPRLAPRVRPCGTARLVFNYGGDSSWAGVHVLGGTTIQDNFYVGLGTGFEILPEANGGFLPLFAEATWYPVDEPAAPFFTIEAGFITGWVGGDHLPEYDANWIGFAFGVLGSFWDGTGLMFRIGTCQFSMKDHPLFGQKKKHINLSIGVIF